MGSEFAPYVAPLLPVITTLMIYQHSHQIRKFSLKTFNNILRAVGESQNVGLFQQAFTVYLD